MMFHLTTHITLQHRIAGISDAGDGIVSSPELRDLVAKQVLQPTFDRAHDLCRGRLGFGADQELAGVLRTMLEFKDTDAVGLDDIAKRLPPRVCMGPGL
jgi:hypothetical protein